MRKKLSLSGGLLVQIAIAVFLVSGCWQPRSNYRSIHEAVINGDSQAVKDDLRAKPADLELPDDAGDTPLALAALHCRAQVLDILLERGANVDAHMSGGATPLHLAAQAGCLDAVKALLSHKAKINARDEQGRTPLKRAEEWHKDTVVQYLRDHGGTD